MNDYKMAEPMPGDPHHYEPSTKAIKAMLKSSEFISAPHALHPWSAKIVEQRKQAGLASTVLPSLKNKSSKKISEEALGHFWLETEGLCQAFKALSIELKLPVQNCPYTAQLAPFENSLSLLTNDLIVLTHDALLPLFLSHGLKAHVLKGSGHHEEIGPKAIKEVYKAAKGSGRIVWIIEEEVHFPAALKSKIRSTDLLLDIDSLGHQGESPVTPLLNLMSRLKTLAGPK
jgi:ABC-type Zn uptake system ZnuABC Zn-binding protein ZnuA